VPVMNHKNAWAEEERSPGRRIILSNSTTPSLAPGPSVTENEILIVASKLKQYVKDAHDLNTSADVMEVLSREVRRLTDRAAQKAKADGRKTLMGRDF